MTAGAAPHGTVDAIVEAASLVTSLQTIVSRNRDPQQSGVLTVGKINGERSRYGEKEEGGRRMEDGGTEGESDME